MPKPTKGARLGGSAAHQRHIIANLCKALIEHKSITTTETRAKAVQPHIEKLITKPIEKELNTITVKIDHQGVDRAGVEEACKLFKNSLEPNAHDPT